MTFPFPSFMPAGAAGLTIEAGAFVSSTIDGLSFTFSGVAIGAAAADRIVVLGIMATGAGGGTLTLTGVTVGGNAATKIAFADAAGVRYAAIAVIAVPAGTTADIVCDWSGSTSSTVFRCGVQTWAVYGGMSTTAANANAGDTSDPFESNMAIPAGGGACFAAISVTTNSSVTWTELTEYTDTVVESATTMSTAADAFATGQTIGVTGDVASDPAAGTGRMAIASFGLAA